MRCRQANTVAIIGLLTAALSGCSGSGLTPPVIGEPAPAPATAEVSDPSAPSALQKLLLPKDVVVGTPTEVYTRIARGVLTCWFGAEGPLKAQYIYHAAAEPASRGGNSEIKIMTRDMAADDPRALRAYRVAISPSQDKTRVEIENVRLPEVLANRLKLDVERWAAAEDGGCGETPVTAGWAAEPAVAVQAAKNDKKHKKKP
ncbi:MAG: hypothetical protein K2Y42_08100 [Hyphomicrobium sp.]|jgi:hypothetical protein|uniref:hypothetical protein n=1 Tax=Hyphomicrobium sp. TaxID=82 RepID=UPI0025C04A5B|nr:hypothetical protein [Hyphomicrobium sp.]MBX9862702.1 hypothetical protein [Hyphomicrobium sp.]